MEANFEESCPNNNELACLQVLQAIARVRAKEIFGRGILEKFLLLPAMNRAAIFGCATPPKVEV